MRNSALLVGLAFMFVTLAVVLAGQPASLKTGTELSAALTASVDSGAVKLGDEVTARTTQDVKAGGTVLIPEGSKLIGRVTAAGRDRASSFATLGIAFDRAVLADGREIVLDTQLVAVAAERPALTERREPVDAGLTTVGTVPSFVHRAGGGALETVGGVASAPESTAGRNTTTVGSTMPVPSSPVPVASPGSSGGLNSRGRIAPGSRGVFGIADLEIASAGSSSKDGTLLVSPRRTVDLEKDTQLLLVANVDAATPR